MATKLQKKKKKEKSQKSTDKGFLWKVLVT